jgi:hypothetical protein
LLLLLLLLLLLFGEWIWVNFVCYNIIGASFSTIEKRFRCGRNWISWRRNKMRNVTLKFLSSLIPNSVLEWYANLEEISKFDTFRIWTESYREKLVKSMVKTMLKKLTIWKWSREAMQQQPKLYRSTNSVEQESFQLRRCQKNWNNQ